MESKSIPFRKEEEASKMGDPVPLLLSMMARQYRNHLAGKKMALPSWPAEAIAKTLGCHLEREKSDGPGKEFL